MNEIFSDAYFAPFLHGQIVKDSSDKNMNRPGLRNEIENIKHAAYLEYGVKQTAMKMPILKCSVLTSDTPRRGDGQAICEETLPLSSKIFMASSPTVNNQ